MYRSILIFYLNTQSASPYPWALEMRLSSWPSSTSRKWMALSLETVTSSREETPRSWYCSSLPTTTLLAAFPTTHSAHLQRRQQLGRTWGGDLRTTAPWFLPLGRSRKSWGELKNNEWPQTSPGSVGPTSQLSIYLGVTDCTPPSPRSLPSHFPIFSEFQMLYLFFTQYMFWDFIPPPSLFIFGNPSLGKD